MVTTTCHRVCLVLLGLCAGATELGAEDTIANAEPERFFEQRVHAVLAARCYECHGPAKQENGLRLDSRDAVLQGGTSGEPAAIAGDADKSLLMRAVRHEGDVQMPPAAKLPDEEILVLATWVKLGLPWTKTGAAAKALSAAERAAQDRQGHWAFQPVRRPPIPAVVSERWPTTGMDQFILASLEGNGLSPAPRADRRTLIRRLCFDLHGLPPTPEDVETFLQDAAPDAYEQLVDRLLASPRYGERWGRHWLDVARYADTRGYAFANERRYPYAYTYRDYIISALNADKSYDQFILEQLAADQIALDDKRSLAAMGLLTTGRRFNNRNDDLDDQIDVVCRGLMGLTVACARCHDHKYDAVPTEDYYSLYGVFASSEEPKELPLIGEPRLGAAYEEFEQELGKRRGELEKFRADKYADVIKTARERVSDYLERVIELPPELPKTRAGSRSLGNDELRPRLIERWHEYLKQHGRVDHPIFGPWSELAALSDEQFSQKSPDIMARWQAVPSGAGPGQLHPAILTAMESQPLTTRVDVARAYGGVLKSAYDQWTVAGANQEAIDKLPAEIQPLARVMAGQDSPTSIPQDEMRFFLSRADRNKERELDRETESWQVSSPAAPPRAMIMRDGSSPQDAPILLRGNPDRPGDPAPRRFLLVLAGAQRTPFPHGSGRLDLAREIVHQDNPLTRRVIANRIWMHHFGQSLVRTPSDFGVRCDPPVIPGLLDYLASLLLDKSWSLKALHREIVLSSTYQQASLSARENPPAASFDPENRLYWRMNRQRLEFEPLRDTLLAVADRLDLSMGGRPDNLTSSPSTRRRTIYGFIDRQDLPNLLRVFDFASPDQSQADRPRTTVPQQALFLMNSPFAIELAQSLANRSEVADESCEDCRILALYQLVFQREPTSAELDVARRFVEPRGLSEGSEQPNQEVWAQFAQLLLLTNELAFVDEVAPRNLLGDIRTRSVSAEYAFFLADASG